MNGARAAAGLNQNHYAFAAGSTLAGLVAVPFTPIPGLTALAAAMSSDSSPELLMIGRAS